jgi:hypothetical protein
MLSVYHDETGRAESTHLELVSRRGIRSGSCGLRRRRCRSFQNGRCLASWRQNRGGLAGGISRVRARRHFVCAAFAHPSVDVGQCSAFGHRMITSILVGVQVAQNLLAYGSIWLCDLQNEHPVLGMSESRHKGGQ